MFAAQVSAVVQDRTFDVRGGKFIPCMVIVVVLEVSHRPSLAGGVVGN
jgi:hypothetical protein